MLDHSNRRAHYYSCRQMRWSSMAANHCCEQYTVDVQVTGEPLAAKSHNQVMQNITRKILFNN